MPDEYLAGFAAGLAGPFDRFLWGRSRDYRTGYRDGEAARPAAAATKPKEETR